MNKEIDVKNFLKSLKSAVNKKDKKRILDLYGEAEYIEWDDFPDSTFNQYDQLVDKANEILGY